MWPPLLMLALGACGGEGPAGPSPVGSSPAGPSTGVVDSALVGTWVGPIEGNNGQGMEAAGTMTMALNADGSLSVRVSSSRFHPIDSGNWSVSPTEFKATGTDLFGNLVYFNAPRSTTRLEGHWDSGAASGTFMVTKQ
jgi:hypothetical protein